MTTTTAQEPTVKATVTTPRDREIRIERIFNASRDRVWKAMTDPELVAEWWGRGNKLVIEKLEVKRGGHWRFVEHSAEGVHGFEGRFREVTPPERVVQTFEWDGMPGYVIVNTMTLQDLGDANEYLLYPTFGDAFWDPGGTDAAWHGRGSNARPEMTLILGPRVGLRGRAPLKRSRRGVARKAA